jgi:hypothetical protein
MPACATFSPNPQVVKSLNPEIFRGVRPCPL